MERLAFLPGVYVTTLPSSAAADAVAAATLLRFLTCSPLAQIGKNADLTFEIELLEIKGSGKK